MATEIGCLCWSLVILLALAGCHGYETALSAQGPQQKSTRDPSLINSFRASFLLAYRTVPRLSEPLSSGLVNKQTAADLYGAVGPTVSGDAANGAEQAYMDAGFALVDANCREYFQYAGRLQQDTNVYRDLATALAPVATGALALVAPGSGAAAAVALSGAAGTASVDAISRDFLFDARNIDDVQDLVTNALAKHESKVRNNMGEVGGVVGFGWVTEQIQAHQSICQPAHILHLVRQAIATGHVESANIGAPEKNGNGKVIVPSPKVEVFVSSTER